MWEWEIFETFFYKYNIEPHWLDYENNSLWYDSDGGKYNNKTNKWTGALGLVS